MFFEAQVVTQEINRGDKGLQGQVYLYRCREGMQSTQERIKLTYWAKGYEDFMKRVEANDRSLYQYYTVNEAGQIVVTGLETYDVNIVTKSDDSLFDKTDHPSPTYTVTTHEIDYKNLISQYATPAPFFIALGSTTRNPKFLEEIAKMVKEKAKIELTILDTVTEEVETKVENYTEHTVTMTAHFQERQRL